MVLDDENACILHKATGRKVSLYKTGSVFVMRVDLVPPNEDQMNMEDKARRPDWPPRRCEAGRSTNQYERGRVGWWRPTR